MPDEKDKTVAGDSAQLSNRESKNSVSGQRSTTNKLVYWIVGSLVVFGLGYGGYYFGKLQNPDSKSPTNSNSLNSNIKTSDPQIVVETVKITGKVINKITEEGVSGAKIASGGNQTTSDGSGSFTVAVSKSNPLDLSVSADGYIAITSKPSDGATLSLVPQGRVAFTSNKDQGKRGIYTVNYDESQKKPLVERIGETEDYNVVVSPRNRYAAFLSTRNDRKNRYGSIEPALYLVKVDGSGLTKISDFYGISNIKWSPDGIYLAWNGREKDEDQNTKVAVRDIDQGTTVYNGDPGEYLSSYSFAKDDSKMSFYVSHNQSNPSRKGTYIADGNGSNPKKISDMANYGTFNDDNNLEFSEYKDNKTHYYVWYHDSNAVKEVAKKDDSKRTGVESTDKSWVAYIDNRDGKNNVFISKPDKSNEKKLTDVDAASGIPRFTPDGKYIIFDVYKTGESAKYIVSSQGMGKAQKITDQLASGGGMGENY